MRHTVAIPSDWVRLTALSDLANPRRQAPAHRWRRAGRWALTMTAVVSLLAASLAAPRPSAAAPSLSTLVVESRTGRVVQARYPDMTQYPASLTKMMTLYLLFDALEDKRLSLRTPLRVSRAAAAKPPSKLGLRPGQTITVHHAILALTTESANDVAAAIGERLAGSEARFAQRMTQRARALGMWRTVFRNASGLPAAGQITTARDMSVLARALLRDHPRYYHYFGARQFRYAGVVHGNHNRLLGVYRGLDGIKTGYTQRSGFNLVASARRPNGRLIGVVMGAPSAATRNATMVRLLDKGFRAPPTRGPATTMALRGGRAG